MNKNIVIILVSAFLVLILVIAFFVCTTKISEKNNNQDEAIDIPSLYIDEVSNTKDLNVTKYLNFTVYREDGTEVNLSEYEDNPVAILFFDDTEENSIEVLSKFDSLYKQYEDKVKFLMININQDVNEKLKDDYTIEIFYDFYKEATKKYNITEYPAMIYIDKTNEIINSKTGVPSLDAIEANLDILSENF